jgi:hypothetical protein
MPGTADAGLMPGATPISVAEEWAAPQNWRCQFFGRERADLEAVEKSNDAVILSTARDPVDHGYGNTSARRGSLRKIRAQNDRAASFSAAFLAPLGPTRAGQNLRLRVAARCAQSKKALCLSSDNAILPVGVDTNAAGPLYRLSWRCAALGETRRKAGSPSGLPADPANCLL